MIYNDLYDLESFIRVNTINDLKTKNYELKEDDIVFVIENFTFYTIKSSFEYNSETENFPINAKYKAVKTATIMDKEENNNKINGIVGGVVNPSFIQDDSQKTEGQYYLDKPSGKLHKCIKTTISTTNSTEFFKDVSLNCILSKLENLIKIETGVTGDYTNVGAYNFTFPKIYKQVLGVAINVYKTGTAATLENVYLTGFNNTGFSFVKDCVEAARANTVKVAYTVFYV